MFLQKFIIKLMLFYWIMMCYLYAYFYSQVQCAINKMFRNLTYFLLLIHTNRRFDGILVYCNKQYVQESTFDQHQALRWLIRMRAVPIGYDIPLISSAHGIPSNFQLNCCHVVFMAQCSILSTNVRCMLPILSIFLLLFSPFLINFLRMVMLDPGWCF